MRILIIEDERKIISFIKRGLKEEKFVVDSAETGDEGLYMAEVNPYDLILLDVMLPDKDGFSTCKELRAKKAKTPILMLTARNAVHDRIVGLNAGADDYLSKPFAFGELVARIRALLRRQAEEKTTLLKLGDLELNMLNQEVHRGGKKLELTSKEFTLLQYMMLNANQVITRTMISEHVWQEDSNNYSNVIDVYIKYLRNKIDKGTKKKFIHTIRGSGYILKEST